jgi:hypothetical protein
MVRKARTPIVEYEDTFAIELLDEGGEPQERDRLTDQDIVIGYDRRPGEHSKWRLHSLFFNRETWTRSAIRRWWAGHEVWLLSDEQLDRPIPELCRSYPAPDPGLPSIFLCHRNTPKVPANMQVKGLDRSKKKGKP